MDPSIINTGYNSRATTGLPPPDTPMPPNTPMPPDTPLPADTYDDFVRYLRRCMTYHLRMAERGAAAYQRRRSMLKARYLDPAAYVVAKRDDYTIQHAISVLSFHQNMTAMYSAVLGGEAAAEALVASDHTGHLP
jgi:hypothetical protein